MKKNDEKEDRKKVVKEAPLQRKTEIIFEVYDDLIESDRKSSFLANKLGEHLIIAKTTVKKQKLSWKDYCENTLPDIPPYEIRDCMYIASRYQENPLPSLLLLNRTNLKKIFQFCKGKSPKAVLEKNDIDLLAKDASAEEIRVFRVEVLRLLQSAKKKSSQKVKVQSSGEKKIQANPRAYHRKGLLRLMEQDLKKPKGQLKTFTPQTYNYYLAFQKALGQYIKARAPKNDED